MKPKFAYRMIAAGALLGAAGTASAAEPLTVIERLDPYASVAQQIAELKAAVANGEALGAARRAIAQKDFRLIASGVGINPRPAQSDTPGVACATAAGDMTPFRALIARPYTVPAQSDPNLAERDQLLTEYLARFNRAIVVSKEYPDYDICRPRTATYQDAPRPESEKERFLQNLGREIELTKSVPTDGRPSETADIIHAARFARIDALKALLAVRQKVDSRDGWKMTALAWAAVRGKAEAVRVLLDAGADPNLRAGSAGRTPLMFAILAGDEESVDLLLARNVGVDSAVSFASGNRSTTCCSYPLNFAAALGRSRMIGRLVRHGAGVNAYDPRSNATALSVASFLGRRDAALALLDAGASIETEAGYYDDSAFASAAAGGEVAMLDLLAARGADVNWTSGAEPASALHRAILENQRPAVDWLLAHGADVNVGAIDRKYSTYRGSNLSPLGAAVGYADVRFADIEIVRTLIAHGADIHERQGWQGAEPLLDAMTSDSETVTTLLDAGANVAARDRTGRTPLHLLGELESESGSKPIIAVSVLVRRGADINAQDYAGNTPLNTRPCNRPAVVSELLAAGADPNIRNKEGRTPIFEALRCEEVFHALVAAGAKIDIRDIDGVTPRQILEHKGGEGWLKPPKKSEAKPTSSTAP